MGAIPPVRSSLLGTLLVVVKLSSLVRGGWRLGARGTKAQAAAGCRW